MKYSLFLLVLAFIVSCNYRPDGSKYNYWIHVRTESGTTTYYTNSYTLSNGCATFIGVRSYDNKDEVRGYIVCGSFEIE